MAGRFWPCTCCGSGYSCVPMASFDFYDPNTGIETTPSYFSVNLVDIWQWPSGQLERQYFYGNNQLITVFSGYTPCTVVPIGPKLNLAYSPNTYISGAINNVDYFFDHCWGDHTSQNNIYMDMLINPIPTFDSSGLLLKTICWNAPIPLGSPASGGGFPLCSVDICQTGHYCIQVPFCPTYFDVTWDQSFSIHGSNFSGAPAFILATVSCTGGVVGNAPYISCTQLTNSFWERFYISPIFHCTGTNLRCGMKDPNSNGTIPYPANIPVYFISTISSFLDFGSGTNPTWNTTEYVPDCVSQKLNMCVGNTVNIGVTNKGVGSWCPDGTNYPYCGCGGCCVCQNLRGKFPTGPITINGSVSGHYVLINPFGTTVVDTYITFPFSATASLDMSKTGPCDGGNCLTGNSASAVYTSVSTSITPIQVPVLVFQHSNAGVFYAGVGYYPLSELVIGGSVFSIDGPTPCANGNNASISLAYSINGTGPNACFDSGLNFTGFAPNNSGCGCVNAGSTCYIGVAAGFGLTLGGSGTIDVCSDIIAITLLQNTTPVGFLSN